MLIAVFGCMYADRWSACESPEITVAVSYRGHLIYLRLRLTSNSLVNGTVLDQIGATALIGALRLTTGQHDAYSYSIMSQSTTSQGGNDISAIDTVLCIVCYLSLITIFYSSRVLLVSAMIFSTDSAYTLSLLTFLKYRHMASTTNRFAAYHHSW